jgi:hypothetical protein
MSVFLLPIFETLIILRFHCIFHAILSSKPVVSINLIKYTNLMTAVLIKGDDVSPASESSCSLSVSPVLLRSDLRSLPTG